MLLIISKGKPLKFWIASLIMNRCIRDPYLHWCERLFDRQKPIEEPLDYALGVWLYVFVAVSKAVSFFIRKCPLIPLSTRSVSFSFYC